MVFAASQMPVATEQTNNTVESPESPSNTAVSTPTPQDAGFRSNGCVDISDLIFKCGFDASALLALSVCPALEDYRNTIGTSLHHVPHVDPHSILHMHPLLI